MHMTSSLDLAGVPVAALESDDKRANKGDETFRHIAGRVGRKGDYDGHGETGQHGNKCCTCPHGATRQPHDQDRTEGRPCRRPREQNSGKYVRAPDQGKNRRHH